MLVMREFRLQLFLAICQNLKPLWHVEILLTQNHMGLEISKRYSSYNFHPIWAKLYEKYGSPRGIQNYGHFDNLWHFAILT